jgi:hypothetical protein
LKSIAKRKAKLLQMVDQAKLRSYCTAPKYQYGYEVPRDYKHAVSLDKKNGTTKWQDAVKLKMSQLAEYDTFTDHGHNSTNRPPEGYKKICVHLFFTAKHDGRHTRCLIADADGVPLHSVYSGVVSLHGIHLIVFQTLQLRHMGYT